MVTFAPTIVLPCESVIVPLMDDVPNAEKYYKSRSSQDWADKSAKILF